MSLRSSLYLVCYFPTICFTNINFGKYAMNRCALDKISVSSLHVHHGEWFNYILVSYLNTLHDSSKSGELCSHFGELVLVILVILTKINQNLFCFPVTQNFTVRPSDVRIYHGHNATFKCVSVGVPTPRVSWVKIRRPEGGANALYEESVILQSRKYGLHFL